jgi:hypothetical protein
MLHQRLVLMQGTSPDTLTPAAVIDVSDLNLWRPEEAQEAMGAVLEAMRSGITAHAHARGNLPAVAADPVAQQAVKALPLFEAEEVVT